VNAENAAGGLGLTKPTACALLDAGADALTLGNHSFAKRDLLEYLKNEPRVLRPANYPPGAPGRGWGVFSASDEHKLAVVSLLGRTFMAPIDCPFRALDSVLAEIDADTSTVVVDMHAEATSEKKAMGWYADGRASAVIGTHTHVQTSDEGILPGGTAYITDVGMTGVHDSVLGLDKDSVIQRFLTQVPGKFTLAEGQAMLQGVVVEIDPRTGRAASIERVNVGEAEIEL
jgi:metallophosphoesterase (TIGR00282 family)